MSQIIINCKITTEETKLYQTMKIIVCLVFKYIQNCGFFNKKYTFFATFCYFLLYLLQNTTNKAKT